MIQKKAITVCIYTGLMHEAGLGETWQSAGGYDRKWDVNKGKYKKTGNRFGQS